MSQHYGRDEILEMLADPADVAHIPGGGFQVKKGGIVGLGTTRRSALIDWSQEFARVIVRPKAPAADPGADTDPPIPVVSMTDVAPPV
jgi:hypothetical protein